MGESRIAMKMRAICKQWENVKITGKLDVFPNESSFKVFYDMETLEISWTDTEFFRDHSMVRHIENALRMKPKPMFNAIFDVIDFWSYDWNAKSFIQSMILAMSVHADVDRV